MAPPLLPILIQQQQGGGVLRGEPISEPSQYATYSIQVAWSGVVSNAFRLDISALDGSDELTSTFDVDFSGEFDELVGMEGYGVKSCKIRRGREDDLADMGAGECTVVLHDPDGRFNPKNASSDLAGQLLPMRQLRVTATNDGGANAYPLYRGFIRSIEHDPRLGAQETTINAVDLFLWMSRVQPAISNAGGTTTGAAIGRVLDEVGWTLDELIDLDEGDSIPAFRSEDGASALAVVQELLRTELGVYYVAGDGTATYEDRYARSLRDSVATLDDTMMGLRPGTDLDRIANRARVTRSYLTTDDEGNTVEESGEQQTAGNGESQATYGIADVGDIESIYLASDLQAASLAKYLVGQRSSPQAPVWGLDLINRDADTMTQILSRELQDRITVADSRGGTDGDFHIEGIEHDITDGGKYHRATWKLSERGASEAFVVGSSLVGGPDLIAY